MSREKTPKQLIKLLGDRSLLQQAVDRVAPLVPMSNVLVITNQAQAAEVCKQLPKLPRENVICEPLDAIRAPLLPWVLQWRAPAPQKQSWLFSRQTTSSGIRKTFNECWRMRSTSRGGDKLSSRSESSRRNPQPATATFAWGNRCRLRRVRPLTRRDSSAPNNLWRSRTRKGGGIRQQRTFPLERGDVRLVLCDHHRRAAKTSACHV